MELRLKLNIYQIITDFLNLFSGDLGFILRRYFYKIMGVKIGKSVKIYQNVKIYQPCNLILKRGSSLGYGSVVSALKRIEIGEGTMVSPYCCIYDHDHKMPLINPDEYKIEPVKIGNKSWIGAHSTILKGVTIGNNVSIGAGAVVTKDIPDNAVAVGIPAKIIKKI